MKKPEKKDQLEIAKMFCLLQPCEILKDEATGGCYACKIGSSIKNTFEQLWDKWNKYHEWDIKENYIRKDELPSVAELAGILDAHRHCSISMQVRKILERIKGEI